MADTYRSYPDHEGLQVISHAEAPEVIISPCPASGNTAYGSHWTSPLSDTPITKLPSSPRPTLSFASPNTTEKFFYDPVIDGLRSSQTSLPAGGSGKDLNQRERRICGIRRRIFWIILGLSNLAIIIALGLGVGLAIGLKEESAAASPPATPSATSSTTQQTTSTKPTPTTTWGIPLPSATAQAVTNSSGTAEEGTRAGCPLNDRTTYLAYGTNIRFLLMCGRDYPGDEGDNVSLLNDDRKEGTHSAIGIGECIELCAARGDCEGVGFYYNMCLFKRRARTPKKKEETYPFAMRIIS